MRHEALWTQPPALWPAASAKYVPERATEFQQPVILRFTNDNFMEDFMETLAQEPNRIKEWKVRHETWRGFMPPPQPSKRASGGAVFRHLRIHRRPAIASGLISETALPASAAPVQTPFKLYQPAHQRHYLVTSSLVCRTPGLPDRSVDSTREERAGFVLRRLLPPTIDETDVATWEEHAWVPGAQGAVWRKLSASAEDALAEGEELLPMFGAHYGESGRRTRRLFAGVIPAGKREAYLGAPMATSPDPPGVTSRTARKILLRKEVIEPWKNLISRAQKVNLALSATGDAAPNAEETRDRLIIERGQLQEISWLILLDFARYLSTYAPSLWTAIVNPAQEGELDPAQVDALDALEGTDFTETLHDDFEAFFDSLSGDEQASAYNVDDVAPTLRAALAKFVGTDGGVDTALAEMLELNNQPFDLIESRTVGENAWPDFLFPLADPLYGAEEEFAPLPPASITDELGDEDKTPVPPDGDDDLTEILERLDGLAVLIVRALEDQAEPAPEPAIPTAAVAPADALRGVFRIRCVLDRPDCLPLHGAVVSEPTEPFEIAGYFDPDAPARPIRIGLPIDTTPAGLRKFDKNTAFVISDTLCGQIRRMKGITFGDLVLSVLPWPFHKDLPGADGEPCKKEDGTELGMICSLSIPIITLCALILLIIMVTLFDIIFRWLPFFILCFPLPNLAAKFKPPGS